MNRTLLPGILAMAAIVVASNILVQFLFGQWLTFGAFTYPFAFLVTDLTNRFQGPKAARTVVIAGFAVYQGREVFRGLAERLAAALMTRAAANVISVPTIATKIVAAAPSSENQTGVE